MRKSAPRLRWSWVPGKTRWLAAQLVDPNFNRRLPNYMFQSGLATVSLIVIVLLQDAVLRAAIVVAIASSAAIVFVVPHSIAASPRKVVGGHVVAVATGSIFAWVLMMPALASAAEGSRYLADIMAALAVGLAILIMGITNTEHPPAAGTALGLVVQGWTGSAVGFVLVGAVVLTVVRIALIRRLVNLV